MSKLGAAKLRNACYHSVPNRLSYRLLSKKSKIKIQDTPTVFLFSFMSVKLGVPNYVKDID
jgi:hypothetical protein